MDLPAHEPVLAKAESFARDPFEERRRNDRLDLAGASDVADRVGQRDQPLERAVAFRAAE